MISYELVWHGCEKKADSEDQPKLAITELTKQEQRRIVHNVLAEYNDAPAVTDPYAQAVCDAARLVVDDIELFYSRDMQNHAQHIFATFNLAETACGEAVLAKMLASPTTDITVLRNRQALIAELIENEDLFDACQSIVRDLKKSENALYSAWIDDNKATKDLIDALYPVEGKGILGKALGGVNKNSATLELYTRLGNLGTCINV